MAIVPPKVERARWERKPLRPGPFILPTEDGDWQSLLPGRAGEHRRDPCGASHAQGRQPQRCASKRAGASSRPMYRLDPTTMEFRRPRPVQRQRAVVISLPDATRGYFHLSSRQVAWPCRFCQTGLTTGGKTGVRREGESRREYRSLEWVWIHETERNLEAACLVVQGSFKRRDATKSRFQCALEDTRGPGGASSIVLTELPNNIGLPGAQTRALQGWAHAGRSDPPLR